MTDWPYAGQGAVLATMHGEKAAFGPALARELGLRLIVPEGIDTDALGTFTGEVVRQAASRMPPLPRRRWVFRSWAVNSR